jgi:hypothetical protein
MGGIIDVVHVGLLFCFVHFIEEKFILEKPVVEFAYLENLEFEETRVLVLQISFMYVIEAVFAYDADDELGLLPSPYIECDYNPKLHKDKLITEAELQEEEDLFSDVDPYLDLDYAAAMGGATTQVRADSLVPVHNNPDGPHQPSLIHLQSQVASFISDLSEKNGYNHCTSSLSYSVSYNFTAVSCRDWKVEIEVEIHGKLRLLHHMSHLCVAESLLKLTVCLLDIQLSSSSMK